MNFPLTAHHEVANRQRACGPLRCAAFWVLGPSCADPDGLRCVRRIAESEAAADTPKCRRLDPCAQPISTGSGDRDPKARTLGPPKLPTKSSSATSWDLDCPLRAGSPAIPIALSHRRAPRRSIDERAIWLGLPGCIDPATGGPQVDHGGGSPHQGGDLRPLLFRPAHWPLTSHLPGSRSCRWHLFFPTIP